MSETYKDAIEVFPLTVDFANEVPAGVTVDASNARGTSAVKAYQGATEVTDTLIVAGATTTSGTRLQGWVQGGTAGGTYRLEFIAATSDGRILTHDISIYVRPS